MLKEPIPGIVIGVELSLLKKSLIARLIPLTCVNVPIPNSPTHAPKNAKTLASHFHLGPIPFSMYIKGPPRALPSASKSLNLMARNPSEYFVAIPINAVTTIQNSAPGPPVDTAVATPTILPVPTVADKAVIKAPKLDTSPFSSPLSSFSNIHLRARGSFLN